MSIPFNSQVPPFIHHTNTYCAKVLPAVYDNSLTYYENICRLYHVVNKCIDALNAQNLNIIEFTKMVSLEIEKFEEYVNTRMDTYENELKKAFEEFKTQLLKDFEDYKNALTQEWETEKELNRVFRETMLNDFNNLKTELKTQIDNFLINMTEKFNAFKTEINNAIEDFETRTGTDLTEFKTTMQTQQNEFETHMVELFNNFKTTEKQARTDFETNFQQLFEQWKVDTLNAIETNLTQWESSMRTALYNYIDAQMSVYKDSIEVRLVDSERKITQEKESREQADAILQRQINELTPEGAIKADEPDADNNSQLYKINQTTQERENIYPTTNINKMIPRRLTVSSLSPQLTFTAINLKNKLSGTHDLGAKMFLFKKEDLQDPSDFNPFVSVAYKIFVEGDFNNEVIRANPRISFYIPEQVLEGYVNIGAVLCLDNNITEAPTNASLQIEFFSI